MYIYNREKNVLKPSNKFQETDIGFNAIGDIHLDFYFANYSRRFENPYRAFAMLMVMHCEVKEEILLICGDIADTNRHTLGLFKELVKLWKYIVVIPGNHDWYNQNKNTDNRYLELIDEVKKLKLTNIYFLGDTIDVFHYRGLNIGGAMMMYDISSPGAKFIFRNLVADSRFLSEDFVKVRHHLDIIYYNKYIDQVDIFLTHVPIVSMGTARLSKIKFYLNSEVQAKQGVLYLHGHVHERGYYCKNGITAINVSSGIPIGKGFSIDPVVTSIKVR